MSNEPSNPARHLSSWIDALFRPIGRTAGALAGGLAGDVAHYVAPRYEELVRQKFTESVEALPRLGAEIAAFSSKRLPLKALGLGDVLLRSSTRPGADLAMGLGETAAFAVAPKAGHLGEKLARPLAQKAASLFDSRIGRTISTEAAKAPFRIAGSIAPFEAAAALDALQKGHFKQHLETLGTPEHIVGTAASILPFEVMRIPGIARNLMSSRVEKTPITEDKPVFRVKWNAHERERFRDFGSEDVAKDFADNIRKTVGGEPVVEPAGSMPRERMVYNMAFKPEQKQGPFGLTGVDLLNEPAKSGLKLAPDKDGNLDSKSLLGRLKTVLPPAEFDIYEKAGLGQLLASRPKISAGEVQDWMAENGPRVETRILKSGQEVVSQNSRLKAQLQHELETLVGVERARSILESGQGEIDFTVSAMGLDQATTEKVQRLYHDYNNLEVSDRDLSFDPDVYRSIAPKDADQTVVMVRVPLKEQMSQRDRATLISMGEVAARESRFYHKGGHFGPEDINVLGWARMQYEDVGGKKVAHVIEVQSDWGKAQREAAKAGEFENRSWMRTGSPHPLLADYNRLVLKAAIDQAIKDGAERIVVSDAETAMMTEGHDARQKAMAFGPGIVRQGEAKAGDFGFDSGDVTYAIAPGPDKPFNRRTAESIYREAKKTSMANSMGPLRLLTEADIQPPQAPGMRLNYDTILPKIMEELTGEKGKKVDLGPHQKAFEFKNEDLHHTGEPVAGRSPVQRSNLIFKTQEGTDKINATGLEYGLLKVKAELDKQGAFPLFGKGKFIKDHIQHMQVEGYEPDQILRAAENLRGLKPLKGETPLMAIARMVGIDPKLLAKKAPGEAMEQAFDFFTSVFHHNYGETPERAAYLARQVMTPLEKFAPYMKQTAFTTVPANEGKAFMASVPTPASEALQYVIGVLKRDKKGISPETSLFEAAWQVGHESTHNMGKEITSPVGTATPEQYQAWNRALANVESIPPDARKGIIANMMRLLVPAKNYDEVSKVNLERYADDPEEFLADFGAMLSLGASNKSTMQNMKDLMTFGDKFSQDFSAAVYKDLASTWGMTRDWLRVSLGANPDASQKNVLRMVDGVYENVTKLMQTREEAERTFATFNAYMDRLSTGPLEPPPVVTMQQMHKLFERLEDFRTLASHAVGKAIKPDKQDMAMMDEALSFLKPGESSERAAGERLGFFRDFFKPMVQLVESLKEKVPSAIPVKDLAFSFRSMVSDAQTNAWKIWQTTDAYKKDHPFITKMTGGVDWKRLEWISKEGSAQERAFNKIVLATNVRQEKEGNNALFNRKEMEEISSEYKGMSEADKARFDDSVEQAFAIGRMMDQMKVKGFRDRVNQSMAKVLMSQNKNLFHDRAYEMAKGAVDMVFDAPFDPMDPTGAANQARLQEYMASLALPEGVKPTFIEAIQKNKINYEALQDELLGPVGMDGTRPGKNYLPEVRTREWQLVWKTAFEKLPHHESFNSEKEAVARKKQVEAMPDLEYVESKNRKDKSDRFHGMTSEELSDKYTAALEELKDSVLKNISADHPEAKEIIQRIKDELQPAAAFAEVAGSPYAKKREFLPGRENLNMAEALVRYVDATAYEQARRHVKQAGIATLFNPDMRANPNIRNEFEKWLRFVTDAQGKEFDLLRNLVFFNYIGFNPATMMVEPTQQLVTLVPYLVENGFGPGQSYKALWNANKDLIRANTQGKPLESAIEARMLKQAEDSRVIDTGFTADLYGETDLDFSATRSKIMGNGKIGETVDLLKRPLYQMLALSRKVYSYATIANGRAAMLSAFRLAYNKSSKADPEARYQEAYNFARQATDATMFGGGRANRPPILQRFGQLSGVGGVMYSLGSYTLNAISMMARLTRKAIQEQIKDPVQRGQATKAAGIMFATQLALGGVLGLPLVAPGLAILEKLFPGLDGRKAIREGLVNLAGEDEDMGHYVADGSMRGLLNLSGVDFGSRFQLGNLLGVSPYDGFSWRNLFGPAATMMENWGKGVQNASEGRWGDAARTAAPTSVKNVLNLIHNDWAIRDRAGRLIGEMSPAEKTLAVIGFKPNRLANFYEQQAMLERTEDRKSREVRDLRTEIAKLMVKGDVQGARKRLIEGLNEVGPYDPMDMAREAIQLAHEMQNPTPLPSSRTNEEDASSIARLYPKEPMTSERARVLKRALMMRQLGLSFGRPNIGELRKAALIDQYLAANRNASPAKARLEVERMLSPAVRRRLAMTGFGS